MRPIHYSFYKPHCRRGLSERDFMNNIIKCTQNRTRKKIKLTNMQKKEERAGYCFLLLSLIGTSLFVIIPIVMSSILGFSEWNPMEGIKGIDVVGVENFKAILSDDRVRSALGNNLKYSLTYVPLTIALALVLANLLNKFVFMRVPIRMMMFMPYISSMVSVATVWMVLLYPKAGPINSILTGLFHISNPPGWFISSNWALLGIIIMSVWHDIGYYMIIILANMQGLSKEVYESASVDGANPLQTFFHITIPMLSPALFFCITLATINSFKIFDQVNIITEGGPGFSTTVLVQCIYYYAFKEFNFGYAAAVAMLLFAVIFIFTRVLRKIEDRFTY